jgi:hypothetical protein
MRFRELRRTLQAAVLATMSTSGVMMRGCPCPTDPDTATIPADTDPAFQQLVDKCRSASDCVPMCIDALRRRDGVAPTAEEIMSCRLVERPGEPAMVEVSWLYYCAGGGRKPEALRAAAPVAAETGAVGAWLARLAQLELGAVPAFTRLAAELAAHGAPHRLVRAARRAAADEVRHAALAAALARRHGASVPAAEAGPTPVRALAEVAAENAAEGLVRERWGAAVATWQAAAAGDPAVRAAMRVIARDETRHAALAHAIHAWALPRLGAAERRAVRAAGRQARAELAAAIAVEPDPALVRVAGVPTARAARRLYRISA